MELLKDFYPGNRKFESSGLPQVDNFYEFTPDAGLFQLSAFLCVRPANFLRLSVISRVTRRRTGNGSRQKNKSARARAALEMFTARYCQIGQTRDADDFGGSGRKMA